MKLSALLATFSLALAKEILTFRTDLFVAPEINVKSQATFFPLANGNYVIVNPVSFTDADIASLAGKTIEAIVAVHPFHTLNVEKASKTWPTAKVYGTKRHIEKVPQVNWEDVTVDETEILNNIFNNEIIFEYPSGLELVPEPEAHAGSVLVYHPASKSLHVDDTFVNIDDEFLANAIFQVPMNTISLHPDTLASLSKEIHDHTSAATTYALWLLDSFVGLEMNGEAQPTYELNNLYLSHNSNVLLKDVPAEYKSNPEDFFRLAFRRALKAKREALKELAYDLEDAMMIDAAILMSWKPETEDDSDITEEIRM